MAYTFVKQSSLALAALFLGSVSAAPLSARSSVGFPYGVQKVRGVNLGGWLVLEPWITPSIFDDTCNDDIVDEYTFGQYQDPYVAQTALKNHWDSWVTESDFADIAAAGLNHVRIPIGYWAFDISNGEPYITGQYPYLKQAVVWARNHGIKVLIDLHGVPGSQNGFDNSGRRGDTTWHTNPKNVDRSRAIIQTLATEFSQAQYASVVTSIAVVNEPAGFREQKVIDVSKQYFKDTYQDIRSKGSVFQVIHDAFQPLSTWKGFMPRDQYQNVIMDTHHYEVFSDGEAQMTEDQHISTACARGNEVAAFDKSDMWTVVGEWTTSPNDCAEYLNGRGKGARFDSSFDGGDPNGKCANVTGDRSGFSEEYKGFMRKYFEAQTSSFEKSQGWIYWTWKAENSDEWSYQAGLAGGWIPQDPTARMYPNICPS